MTEEELSRGRDYFVAKSNEVILLSRYSLSLQQYKVLLCIISKIKPDDTPDTEYKISVKDIVKTCGYIEGAGKYYRTIKADIKAIADASCYIETAPDREELFRWLDTVSYDKGEKSTYTVRFHSSVAPYLFDLKERYTLIRLYYFLCLSHKYSIRLYEYLCVMKYRGTIETSIAYLKRIMDAEHYTKISHFKERAFEPAIEDINNYTELNVEYEYKRTGRNVTHVVFRYIEEDAISYTVSQRKREAKINPDIRRSVRERKQEVKERRERIRKEELIQGEGTVTAQLTLEELLNSLDGGTAQ